MFSSLEDNAGDRGLIAFVIAVEAATLAVMSTLHLSGALQGAGAGPPEAVICVALLAGAFALQRRSNWRAATAAVAFAVAGFAIGLTFTITGGSTVDVAYHLTGLPLLLLTLLVLLTERHPDEEQARHLIQHRVRR